MVTRLCIDRRVGVGDEKESDVEHSDLALLFIAGYFCACNIYFINYKYLTLFEKCLIPRRNRQLGRYQPLGSEQPPNENEGFYCCPFPAIQVEGIER